MRERRAKRARPERQEAFNQSGNLHGGAIATLIDVACGSMAARSSSFEPGRNTIVTADLHVRYLGRPKGDVVRAEARLLRAGRQLVVVECQVLDTLDNVIAAADFSAMVVPLRDPLRASGRADNRAPDL
ncbi:MAG: PaaI family thioesterase [Acidimicrobiia bacterium]